MNKWINNETKQWKKPSQIWTPSGPRLPPILGGGSSAASTLKIWDLKPLNMKTLFEQKKKKNIFA